MKKYTFILLVFSFIVVFGISFYFMNKKSDFDKTIHDEYRMESYNLSQIRSIEKEQFLSDNIVVDKEVSLLSENGNIIPISSIISQNDKFIIRFNDIGCTSCIKNFTDSISNTLDYIKKIGFDNVAILLNTDNPRDIMVFKKQFKMECDVYALPVGKIPIEIETQDAVVSYYYFVLTNRRMVEDCFISIQNLPDRTNFYFDSIERRFLNTALMKE